MIEVVLFTEEADSPRGADSSSEASTAEPPPPAGPDDEAGVLPEPVGIFVDVEDGDPLGPAEEVVLDVAVI
ncbi:MAG: hypothetical protein V7603_2823 [Micromonosporaceae bacterium]|jgi:hypothetical protein